MKREYMIRYREQLGLDLQSMAKKCKISKGLLEMLEDYDKEVTHPKIAERVGRAYKLNKAQVEELMPEHYRKSSPNYDPEKYRGNEFDFNDFAIMQGWKGPKFL